MKFPRTLTELDEQLRADGIELTVCRVNIEHNHRLAITEVFANIECVAHISDDESSNRDVYEEAKEALKVSTLGDSE